MHNVEPEGLELVRLDESNPTPLYAELPAPAISAVMRRNSSKLAFASKWNKIVGWLVKLDDPARQIGAYHAVTRASWRGMYSTRNTIYRGTPARIYS